MRAESEIWKNAIQMAEYLGFSMERIGPDVFYRPTAQYDGHTAKAHGIGFAFHEVAHWILATPNQRKVVNFGCGPDPDYSQGMVTEDIPASKMNSTTLYRLEERVAFLAERIGYMLGDCLANYRTDPPEIERMLTKQGHIYNGVPAIVLEYIEHRAELDERY